MSTPDAASVTDRDAHLPTPTERRRNRRPWFERYAWRFHWRFAAALGVWAGVNVHSPFVLAKEFAVSADVLAIFFALGGGSLLLGLFSGPLMQGRSKRPFFLAMGIGGRLGTILMAFAPVSEPWLFLLGFALVAACDSFLLPAITSFYQAGYGPRGRSRAFSHAQVIATIVLVTTSLGAGYALTHAPWTRAPLFLIAGMAGVLAYWTLSRVRFRGQSRFAPRPVTTMQLGAPGRVYGSGEGVPGILPAPPQPRRRGATAMIARGARRVFLDPIASTFRLLATDRRFLQFEAIFMCYGFAFISMQVVLTMYLTERHNVTYEQVGLLTGLIFHGAVVLTMPVMSRFYTGGNPVKFAACAIAALVPVPMYFLFAPTIEWVCVAYVWFAIAMTGIMLVWNMVSIYFAGAKEVTGYMGAHVLGVGVRGASAPFLGALVKTKFGAEWAFGVSTGLFFVGAVLMAHMAWQERKRASLTSVDLEPIRVARAASASGATDSDAASVVDVSTGAPQSDALPVAAEALNERGDESHVCNSC